MIVAASACFVLSVLCLGVLPTIVLGWKEALVWYWPLAVFVGLVMTAVCILPGIVE